MLRREKLARALAEGALDAARRDYSKAMREVIALQRNPPAAGRARAAARRQRRIKILRNLPHRRAAPGDAVLVN